MQHTLDLKEGDKCAHKLTHKMHLYECMNAQTYAHTHTHTYTQTNKHTHRYTHTLARSRALGNVPNAHTQINYKCMPNDVPKDKIIITIFCYLTRAVQ